MGSGPPTRRTLAREAGGTSKMGVSTVNCPSAGSLEAEGTEQSRGGESGTLEVKGSRVELVTDEGTTAAIAGHVRQVGVCPQRHPDPQLAATSSPLTSSSSSPSITSSLALARDSALM